MTPEQFTYWLQGFVEIRGSAPTAGEWDVIKDHLATVFKKVTPTYPMVAPYTPSPIPWTTSPNWIRPEITCSVSAAGGVGFSGINIEDLK
jgi:hypothetical protein